MVSPGNGVLVLCGCRYANRETETEPDGEVTSLLNGPHPQSVEEDEHNNNCSDEARRRVDTGSQDPCAHDNSEPHDIQATHAIQSDDGKSPNRFLGLRSSS